MSVPLRASMTLAVFVLSQTPAPPGAQPAGRKVLGPNTLEEVYVEQATRLAAATGAKGGIYPVPDPLPVALSVCDKINPDAVSLSTNWGGAESWSYAYLHSICIMRVAEWARAPELCGRMRVLSAAPRRPLPPSRRTPYTREECRAKTAGHGGPGWQYYGTEMMLLLLGYSRAEMIKAADGVLPEHGGAFELESRLLPVPNDEIDYYAAWEDHLKRFRRLPDFSRGDARAMTELDRLVEGWNVRGNTTRLALALRCAVVRLEPGTRLSEECLTRMTSDLGSLLR